MMKLPLLAAALRPLRSDVNDDGLHPNAAGYAVMAPLAESAIAGALAAPARRPGPTKR